MYALNKVLEEFDVVERQRDYWRDLYLNAVSEKGEARRVACEQYTRANSLEESLRDACSRHLRAEREKNSYKVSTNIWTTSGDFWKDRVKKLEREKRELVELISELTDCLIWCSGSADFNTGGQAVAGWNNMVRPVLAKAKELLAKMGTFTLMTRDPNWKGNLL